jgi:hypothetical protein
MFLMHSAHKRQYRTLSRRGRMILRTAAFIRATFSAVKKHSKTLYCTGVP